MSGVVASLVLLAAWMHAGWNLLVKRSPDGQLDTVSFAVTASGLAAMMLPVVPLPQVECVPWMAASLLAHVAYFITLIKAYRYADLSVTYPLMRGLAPVLLTGLTAAAGEVVSTGQAIGISLIGIGIALPVWIDVGRRSESRSGLLLGSLNAVIIAFYTFLDGMGVRHAGSASGYTVWMFLFNGWGILAYTVWRRGHAVVWQHMLMHWQLSVIGAAMSLGAYGIVLWAMTQAPLASVAALREVSVVLAAVMGAWWLRERMGATRIAGACLVGCGVILIKLFGVG